MSQYRARISAFTASTARTCCLNTLPDVPKASRNIMNNPSE